MIVVAVLASLCSLALFGLGMWAFARSLEDQTYVAACSLQRQKCPLVLAVMGSAVWMYGYGQWIRAVDPVDSAPVDILTALVGIGGFALLTAAIESRYRASVLGVVLGIPVGIGIGVLADAIHPLASGGESNIWPIGIVLWIFLATPGVVAGLGAGILARLVLSKG